VKRVIAGLAFISALLSGASARAVDYHEAALRTAREFALPRYEALAEATAAQARAWDDFCKVAAPRDLNTLDAAFGAAAGAWAQIEFVRYGPIGEGFRFERMAHWPERRNAISRALSNLMSRPEADVLSPERFRETSVAGQGISALERILFEDGSRGDLRSGAGSAKRFCLVGEAIADALAATSREVAEAWRSQTLPQLENADEARARQAVTRFTTDLLTGLQVIEELKLTAPLGKSIDTARPTLSELWRSGRATQTIQLNLQSAHALAAALLGTPPGSDGQHTLSAIKAVASIAERSPENLGEAAADPRRRRQIILLRDAVASAREIVGASLPPALEITTGFNSLDGD